MQKASSGRVSEKPRNIPGKGRAKPRADGGVGELAFEAFGGGRLAILGALAEGALRYTDVVRRVSASEGEVSRHLARLSRAGLIEKQASGRFQLTASGLAAHALSSPLAVVARHGEYFRTHDLSGTPRGLIARLDELGEARLLRDPLEVGEAMAGVFRGASREFQALWVIGRSAVVQERIEMTAPFRAAVGRGALKARCVVLEEEAPLLEGFGDPAFLRRLELRIAKAMPASMVASEAGVLVGFPATSGVADFNQVFFGNDGRFRGWCAALFEHVWAGARPA